MKDDKQDDFDEDLALHEDEIRCPYCGYIHNNSYEREDNSEMDCKNCEKEFEYERIVTVQYSSYRKESKDD